MDGRTAAAEIRKLEKAATPPRDIHPLRVDGRVPIFAVSASLYESDRPTLMENFDGWLLKPLGKSPGRCDPSLTQRRLYPNTGALGLSPGSVQASTRSVR